MTSAIPEFILKKLLVKDSVKIANGRLTFAIRNTFAPGTLLGIQLTIDGKKIPPEKVTLFPSSQEAVTSSSISPQSPFALSMGKTISISVEGIQQVNEVGFFALTKEIGEVNFNFKLGKTKKSTRSGQKFHKPYLLKLPLKASVEIDTTHVLGRISPYIYGQFIEHLENCIYGGIWEKDGSALRQDTLSLIQDLHPPVIRYPGGNFASGYHWQDGIGPRESRPARMDAAWQAEESNKVGTDEFLEFCRAVKCDPLLVVNDGSGTPEEAASWVRYCNSPANEREGRLRAKNGHPEPYQVKTWGIGNEVWGAWQIGTTTSRNYSTRLNEFIDAMKKADPTIKVVAVGDGVLTDQPDDRGKLWNAEILKAAGKKIDHLSWHIYQPDQSAWQENYDLEKLHWSVCAAPLEVEQIIHRIDKQIAEAGLTGKVTQALDEWNLWLTPPADAVSMHKLVYTMRDALYCAGMLNVFIRNSRSLGMTNIAQLVNVLPLIVTNDSQAYATTMYYPFLMYKEMGSKALAVNAQCQTFKNEALGNNIAAHMNVPLLDVTATLDDTERILSVALINRHHSRSMSVKLHITHAKLIHPVKSLVLCASNPLDANTSESPHKVQVHPGVLPVIHKDHLTGRLPACSVTIWKFSLN